MLEYRRANKFLEYGEYNGSMYGTTTESVKAVLEQHRMCVSDINPAVRSHASLIVHPIVIFIKHLGNLHSSALSPGS